MKVCSVTGHRNITPDKICYIEEQLTKEILSAINDGYTHFISGFAQGVDLLFAKLVLQCKTSHPEIRLSAYLPSRERLKTPDTEFHYLLSCCDFVGVIAETYFKGCELQRNRYMIANSNRIIAVYDGRKRGGTLFTINHAKTNHRELHIINVK